MRALSLAGRGAGRSRRWLILAAALALLPGVQIMAPFGAGHAGAEVFTCGTKGHYFVGKVDATGSNWLGAAATIGARYGAVCDTDTSSLNTVSAWAMIAPSNRDGWAQSGYIRWYNHCNVVFAQDSPDGKTWTTWIGTTCQGDTGETNTFTEKHIGGSCTCVEEMEGSRVLQTTGFDPDIWWATPWRPNYAGEANYKASDMPGNSAAPTVFSNLQFQGQDGTFYNYKCQVLTLINDGSAERADGEQWFLGAPSCPGFQIYTDTSPS